MTANNEVWDLWYPKAAATGISFSRGQIEAGVTNILVHALPEVAEVTVRDAQGKTVAEGKNLRATQDSPMARLVRRGDTIEREDIWPGVSELGLLVIMPGGEVGTLKSWWHAADHSEWRWTVEMYNRREDG